MSWHSGTKLQAVCIHVPSQNALSHPTGVYIWMMQRVRFQAVPVHSIQRMPATTNTNTHVLVHCKSALYMYIHVHVCIVQSNTGVRKLWEEDRRLCSRVAPGLNSRGMSGHTHTHACTHAHTHTYTHIGSRHTFFLLENFTSLIFNISAALITL